MAGVSVCSQHCPVCNCGEPAAQPYKQTCEPVEEGTRTSQALEMMVEAQKKPGKGGGGAVRAETEPLLEPKPKPKKDKAATVIPAKKAMLVKTMAFNAIVHLFASIFCSSTSGGEGGRAGGPGGAGGSSPPKIPHGKKCKLQ